MQDVCAPKHNAEALGRDAVRANCIWLSTRGSHSASLCELAWPVHDEVRSAAADGPACCPPPGWVPLALPPAWRPDGDESSAGDAMAKGTHPMYTNEGGSPTARDSPHSPHPGMIHTSYSKRPSGGTKYDPEAPRAYLPTPLARPPPPGKPSPVFCYALPQGLHIIETVGAADVVDQHKGVRVLQAPVFRVRPLLGVEAEVYSRPSSNSSSFPITSQQHSGQHSPIGQIFQPCLDLVSP